LFQAEAQYNLGIAYTFGKGVLKDYKQAVYWYQKAAAQGYAEAQSNLGIAYAFGKGDSICNPKIGLCFCIPLISCFLIPIHGLLIIF
jgi:TPR repeat protein